MTIRAGKKQRCLLGCSWREQRSDGEEVKVEISSEARKGYFPDDIANTFGVPVEEHKREMEVTELDGLVSFGALTSPQREKKE